jgi:hypothetical protein
MSPVIENNQENGLGPVSRPAGAGLPTGEITGKITGRAECHQAAC